MPIFCKPPLPLSPLPHLLLYILMNKIISRGRVRLAADPSVAPALALPMSLPLGWCWGCRWQLGRGGAALGLVEPEEVEEGVVQMVQVAPQLLHNVCRKFSQGSQKVRAALTFWERSGKIFQRYL